MNPQTVNPLNTAKAVGDIRQSTNRKKFQLPNRAKIGDIVNNDDKNDTILDQPKGTRIDLLQNRDRALQLTKHTRTLNEIKEPNIIKAYFPTLAGHSKHWTLNNKQNKAFVLAGAALLQHIANVNAINSREQTPITNRMSSDIML